MPRKLLVRDSAEERIQESQPKNKPFTGTELISNPRLSQFNEVTPKQHFFGSRFLQFRPTEFRACDPISRSLSQTAGHNYCR